MRVSTHKDDPGYNYYQAISHKKIAVFLDGVEQQHVDTADEETGEILRCVLDADGNIQIDPDNPDTIWREKVRGDVKIVVTDHTAMTG